MDHPQSPDQLVVSDASSKNIEDRAGPSHPVEAEAPQDQEYGCKYCTKTFSNKQALGGHQNAHKAERALEKAARDHNNGVRGEFFPGPYLGSYQRFNDHADRSVFNNFPFGAPQDGVRIGYNAYAPAQLPLPGMNNNYPGLVEPEFPVQGAYVDAQFPNTGMGNASSSSRPVYPDLSIFAAPRDGNRDGVNGPGNDQQDEDESGLDLSLKL